jgi:hypothetical protein
MRAQTSLFLTLLFLPAAAPAQEKVDLAVVNRIRAEAFQNSQVMEHLFQLSDVYGPRLADSPNYLQAAEWAVKTLKGWGLEDAKLEKWGTFGRSWSYSRFSAHMLEPQQTPLIGVPLAWAPGAEGPISGEVALAPMRNMEDAAKFKGQLKGKIVLLDAPRELAPHLEADARRYSDDDLAKLAAAPDPGAPVTFRGPVRPGEPPQPRRDPAEARRERAKLQAFLKEEGVLAVLTEGTMGDDGTIFTAPAGSREQKDPLPPVSVALAAEHYNRIARLIEHKIPVRIELDVRARIHEESPEGVNVIADLPGGKKRDEVVMIGGHLDSWQAGTGATDNAAGSAVMLEVVRILTALNLKMDRTVRIGLWDAEEEGLLGSRNYVTNHFADRAKMELKPEHAKLSGYFNFDNGSGKIRGVYLQGNDMMRPVFEAWLAPFKDLGASAITIRNTGGTDHQSFDAVGLPGFQFIQDPLDYMSRTHHTNMDTYDRIQKGDLMQAAAIIASCVYNAATRPEMLPRKTLPKPSPAPF